MNARLGTTGDHHISISAGNEPSSIPDRMRTGCASRRSGVIRAHESIFHGDVPSAEVD